MTLKDNAIKHIANENKRERERERENKSQQQDFKQNRLAAISQCNVEIKLASLTPQFLHGAIN